MSLYNFKDTIQKATVHDRIFFFVLCLCLFFLLISNGGYNFSIYCLISVVVFINLLVYLPKHNKFKLRSSASMMVVVISIVYLLSALICSPTITSFIAVVSVLISVLFIISLFVFSRQQKESLLFILIFMGLISSIIAITLYIFFQSNEIYVYSGRLMFPFQYANTSGLWFCIVAILCWASKNWKLRLTAILPVACCILTKSAGAVGILFIISLIYFIGWLKLEKHERKFDIIAIIFYSAILVFVAVFGLINSGRVFEASQTFIERIIQMYDGVALWLTSPILGIGPDQWQFIYPYVQSAQYTASKIHNSYLQIMLDGGIIALLLFIAFLVYSLFRIVKAKNWTFLICSCSILVHAFFDFDLSFPFMFILLLMFLDGEVKLGNKFLNILFTIIAFVGCCIGIYFNTQLNNSLSLPQKPDKVNVLDLEKYPDFVLNDVKASTYMTIALVNSNRFEDAVLLAKSTNYASSTQQYFAFHSLIKLGKLNEANDYLNAILSSQSFNVDLFDKIHDYLCSEYQNEDLIITYNKCASFSNSLILTDNASYLSGQKPFDLIK